MQSRIVAVVTVSLGVYGWLLHLCISHAVGLQMYVGLGSTVNSTVGWEYHFVGLEQATISAFISLRKEEQSRTVIELLKNSLRKDLLCQLYFEKLSVILCHIVMLYKADDCDPLFVLVLTMG